MTTRLVPAAMEMLRLELHHHGNIAIVGGSVPQLSIAIVSPTLEGIVVQYGAYVCGGAGIDGYSAPALSQRHGVGRFGGVAIHIVPISQLTVGIVSPALNGVVIQNSASVKIFHTDRFGGSVRSQVDSCGSLFCKQNLRYGWCKHRHCRSLFPIVP